MTPDNPALGSTVLRAPAIQSPNFVTGVSGFIFRQDGSAELNSEVIRGGLTIGGTELYYSGTPALDNLIGSVSGTGGTDTYGNLYLPGVVTYHKVSGVNWSAVQMYQEFVKYYSATSHAGPWTLAGSISAYGAIDFTGIVTLTSDTGNVEVLSPLQANNGTPANPTLVTTDSWHPLTLINGWAAAGGNVVPQYMLTPEGDVAIIGALDGSASTNIWFATLPASPVSYRPATQQQFWMGTTGATASLFGQAGTDGSLKVQGSSHAGTYLFNGVVRLLA